jgi:predicted metalloendopeptidase
MKSIKIAFSFFSVLSLTINSSAAAGSRVVDPNLIDSNVSPCEDFFEYACGQWLKKTEIPADRSKVYRFSEIDENTESVLRTILENYKKGQMVPAQKDAAKLGAFYGACVNERVANEQGRKGLQSILKKVRSLKDEAPARQKMALADLLANLHLDGIGGFFGFYVDQDPGDARQVIPQFDQSGLALPEKNYYLDQEDEMVKTRQQYLAHMQKMLKLGGIKKVKGEKPVQTIMAIETELAKASLGSIDRRDPQSIYHKMTLSDLQVLAPQFDWQTYFSVMNIKKDQALNVAVPSFFKAFGDLLANHSIQDIVSYLEWHAIHSVADYAGADLMAEDFNFYGRILNGQKVPRARWKQCVASVDSYLGEALGESFVSVAFGAKAKTMAASMMDQIQNEVRNMFQKLDWMDQHTMEGALRKLNTLVKKVGYPEPSKNYDTYKVRKDSWFANVIAGNRFESERSLAKIGKPVDRNEWGMSASTNNAYYNPLLNEIVFPAGILQEPLFSVNADLAANYGATGATVGHEITHGFDDEGRQFDENGNLQNWWSETSTQKFAERAQCLINQYDQYKVADGVPVQGALTLGENIADLGGLKIALNAYQKVSPAAPRAEEYQRFFVAYAQSWCGKATPEYEKNIVQVDPHSPARFRVNGVVVNMPEFAEAFSCKAGQKMNPVNRCQIW